jgi:spore coat polysaccharide biosynthesis predicted glycosyltransferase SpsG
MILFIFGGVSTLLIVLVLLWCCHEKTPERIDPPVDPSELAATILRNLAAVQLLQLHLNVSSLDYRLAKDLIELQKKYNMVLIGVPQKEIEDVDNKVKEDKEWERLKVTLNMAWADDDDTSADYVN